MIVSDFGGLIHFEIRKQGKKLNIYVTNRDEIHGNFDRSYDFFYNQMSDKCAFVIREMRTGHFPIKLELQIKGTA